MPDLTFPNVAGLCLSEAGICFLSGTFGADGSIKKEGKLDFYRELPYFCTL